MRSSIIRTLMIFFSSSSCICPVVSYVVTTPFPISLLLLHVQHYRYAEQCQPTENGEIFHFQEANSFLFVLCGNSWNVFALCNQSSTSYTVCIVSGWIPISTMSIKRRKEHFVTLVLPFPTNIDSDTRHAGLSCRAQFIHHHIHTEFSNIIHIPSLRTIISTRTNS